MITLEVMMFSCKNSRLVENKDELEKVMNDYVSSVNLKDFESTASYLPKSIYDSLEIQDEIKGMEYFHLIETLISFKMDSLFQIEIMETTGDSIYSRIKYHSIMTHDFNEVNYESKEEFEMSESVASWGEVYGRENIEIDYVNEVMTTHIYDYLYGCKSGVDRWCIFALNDKTKILIPKEIKK